MTMIAEQLEAVRLRLARACSQAGRTTDGVTLVAVSKNFGVQAVAEAWSAGQRAFGENYIQEGVDKIEALRKLLPGQIIQWHCIGPIQSNKTRLVAEYFDWVHSVDRLKIAQRLSEQRPAHLAPLQVCVQVNVDGGANKSGVTPSEVSDLAVAVARLPGLRLRGLMCIPEPTPNVGAQQALFEHAAQLFAGLNSTGLALDTLSMGMSADLEAAVLAGSTMVRVGSAIFGSRSAPCV